MAIVNIQTKYSTSMELDVTSKLNYLTEILYSDTTSMVAGAIVCVIKVDNSVVVT